jgi:hypothetical protein
VLVEAIPPNRPEAFFEMNYGQCMTGKLLIVDLDEMLVHATTEKLRLFKSDADF